jgi:hypothetical protein
MNGDPARNVGAAARAAWGAVVISILWMGVEYGMWLAVLHGRPAWLLTLWGGGDVAWSTVQTGGLLFFGAFELALYLLVLAAIWLSLWARRLRRAG